MCVVVYYIVFAMRNESTMVNSKNLRSCNIVLHCNGMIQLSIFVFDRHVLRLTCVDINMYTI